MAKVVMCPAKGCKETFTDAAKLRVHLIQKHSRK